MAKVENSRSVKIHSRQSEPILVEIEKRFAVFRKSHPPRARIPAALRTAVLGALNVGVPLADLRRVCHISPTQLQYWQASREMPVAKAPVLPQMPKVFSVVDDAPVPNKENELQVRIGEWEIRIRQVAMNSVSPSACCR